MLRHSGNRCLTVDSLPAAKFTDALKFLRAVGAICFFRFAPLSNKEECFRLRTKYRPIFTPNLHSSVQTHCGTIKVGYTIRKIIMLSKVAMLLPGQGTVTVNMFVLLHRYKIDIPYLPGALRFRFCCASCLFMELASCTSVP